MILPLYKSLVRPHLEHAVQFRSRNLRRDIDKMEKIQRRVTKMIPEIKNHSYHQRIQDLDLISIVQIILRRQLIQVFKYLNIFTTDGARGLFDYVRNDRTRNNGAKLIVKHYNTSVAQHFLSINITTTWNFLPNEVVTSRTVNSLKNSLDEHSAENPTNVRVNWLQSSMPFTIQVCTNSRSPALCWKWSQRCVLLLLLLLHFIY